MATASGGEPSGQKASSCTESMTRPAPRAHSGWKAVKQRLCPLHWMHAPWACLQTEHCSWRRACTSGRLRSAHSSPCYTKAVEQESRPSSNDERPAVVDTWLSCLCLECQWAVDICVIRGAVAYLGKTQHAVIDLESQARTLGTRLTSTSGQGGPSVSMKASGTHSAQAAWHQRPQRVRSSAPPFVGHSTQAGAVALPVTNATLRLHVTRPKTQLLRGRVPSVNQGQNGCSQVTQGLVGAGWQAHSLSLLRPFPIFVSWQLLVSCVLA